MRTQYAFARSTVNLDPEHQHELRAIGAVALPAHSLRFEPG
jgi:hypothetical protein